MRKPTFTAGRVLGAVLATAVALGGTVALADSSQAAATVSLTPATGPATTAGVVTVVKGKGFQDVAGATLAGAVVLRATACGTTGATGGSTGNTAATSFNVVSDTKIVVTLPSLGASTYYLCVFTGSTGTDTLLGQGKYVTAAAPAITGVNGGTSAVNASVLGGTVIAVTAASGTGNYTKASKVNVDGVDAKTTYVSSDKLTAVLPAHASGTGNVIKVTSEYGSATATATISFVPVISVSPTTGDGAANNVVTLTGLGFNSYVFGAAATNKVIVFLPAGTTLVSGGSGTAVSSLKTCSTVTVESDTSLSCRTPALTGALGAYSVVIITTDGANYATTVTTISKSATYTAAAL